MIFSQGDVLQKAKVRNTLRLEEQVTGSPKSSSTYVKYDY